MGIFITFEGGEGSGKTTIAKMVIERLEQEGLGVVYTREPGGIEIAEQIRNIILDKNNINMDAKTEALLFAASRRQHLVEKVKPALDAGKVVICDRFVDSSLVYQGITRGLGIEQVFEMNQFAIEGFMPSVTVLLEVHPKIGLERVFSGDREVNRLDLESSDFHMQVYEGYKELAKKFKKRIVTIDASRSINEVYQDTIEVILEKVKR